MNYVTDLDGLLAQLESDLTEQERLVRAADWSALDAVLGPAAARIGELQRRLEAAGGLPQDVAERLRSAAAKSKALQEEAERSIEQARTGLRELSEVRRALTAWRQGQRWPQPGGGILNTKR